ncbi:MAG: hypothetical protein IJ387_01595, partial [Thermoguttaceae bacterium]|nr:hypothetical protein [Thermoguttaceae bacterium]
KPNDLFNAIFRRTASLAAPLLTIAALGGVGEAIGATSTALPTVRAPIYVATAPNNAGAQPLGTPLATPGENATNVVVKEASPVVSSVKYPVARREVAWRDARGALVSALVFYPAAPPIAGAKFSVVVYSHGLGGSAERFAYLGEAWAARGVVTLCLRHPESDETVWRGKLRPMGELKEAYRHSWTARDRALAIRSAIDFLATAQNADGPLGRDLDLTRVGVAGNDLGALAALLVAGQLPPDNGPSLKDPRVSAILALSPPVYCDRQQGSVVYSLIDAPLATVAGTNDDGVVGDVKAEQRRVPFDCVRGVDRLHFTLQGGDHMVYGGHRRPSRQAGDALYQEAIRSASTLFWRAYLCGDSEAAQTLRFSPDSSFMTAATSERVFER